MATKKVLVLTEAAPSGETMWLDGEVVGTWNRPVGFRTDSQPEKGGPVVRVKGTIYKNKTFQATWDQVEEVK